MASNLCVISLFLIYATTGAFGEDSPCSAEGQANNLDGCLTAIRDKATDPAHFWFGHDYLEECPEHLRDTINCATSSVFDNFEFPKTLAEMTFSDPATDLSTLDRYLHVNYTSVPGNYSSCWHDYIHPALVEISIDPIPPIMYTSWELRDLPRISWDASESDLYTLMIINPGEEHSLHGLFVNIPGNDIHSAQTTRVLEYQFPHYFRRDHNAFVFLLYKQTATITVDHTPDMDVRFDVDGFANTYQLGDGPVAMSFAAVKYDPFGIKFAYEAGKAWNCNALLKRALARHPERPWLPKDIDLPVYFSVQYTAEKFSYNCDGKQVTWDPAQFSIDAIGNEVINSAYLHRGQSTRRATMHMNKYLSDDAVDFNGKLYTIMIVNPDVPRAGTNWMPYLVGLFANTERNETLAQGHIVMPYIYPIPPKRDTDDGYVYYLLYEQTGPMDLADTTGFSHHSACFEPGRCFFDVTRFASAYDLQLVGATWFAWTRDEYSACVEYPPEWFTI